MKTFFSILTVFILSFSLTSGLGCKEAENNVEGSDQEELHLLNIAIDGREGWNDLTMMTSFSAVHLTFNISLDKNTIRNNIYLSDNNGSLIDFDYDYDAGLDLILHPGPGIKSFSTYTIVVAKGLKSTLGTCISEDKVIHLSTGLLSDPSFPEITDDELLTEVQRSTFRYFWEGADSDSGMAKERASVHHVVTTGGTGFGIMAICVGAERGFVIREEACRRIHKIVHFLKNKATSYHGAFSHWIYGDTGHTKAFSPDDDGADLVETAFLFQGLLTARAYFDSDDEEEKSLRKEITELWEDVDWNFFTKEGSEEVLYWHWSPLKKWKMNMPIRGWNEALIVYVLAASSPTHPISRAVYKQGWTRDGRMKNGQVFYDITLPLGPKFGGPLFFEHYSFLGLDPRRISDEYANYWEQACAHSKINYEYCVHNPKGYKGYGHNCWGLTSSDTKGGYTASSPANDVGTIAPTAALSSFPYTPKESMDALKFFYYRLGDRLWGRYGFIDAFNITEEWFDTGEHLAIDQGPIIVMIENYRTGLIWKMFMKNFEVLQGLKRLGFNVKEIN